MLEQVCQIAREAGKKIMQIYNSNKLIIPQQKADSSPVTIADLSANTLIIEQLLRLTPDIPILSEESIVEWEQRRDWNDYWLIDPLDGTKEFLQRNGEFTVNIALISEGIPVLGVIYVPVLDVLYFAAEQQAWKEDHLGKKAITVRDNEPPCILTSRSHQDTQLTSYFKQVGKHTVRAVGSSLKFCLIAEGAAQFYPRYGKTCIWDTAAGQAIATAAGAIVEDWQGESLNYYPRESLVNPGFLVFLPKKQE